MILIASVAELDKVRDECTKLVTRRSLASAAVAVVPLPGADIAADISLLTNLLPTISARFGLDHDQVEKLDPHIAERVLVVAASLGNNVIGRTVTRKLAISLLRRIGVRVATASAAKYVPFVGSAIAATISFGAMKLVGNAHVRDCYLTAHGLLPANI